MSFATRKLFGGAITTELPEAFKDASDLRQIPDNQEVFLSPVNDATFIIEILEKVKVDDPSKAVEFHFDSIAHDNDAKSKSIKEIIPLTDPSTREHPVPILLEGNQHVQKFNRSAVDDVLIYIALFRLEKYNVDIVFSANIPTSSGNPDTKPPGEEELDNITVEFGHGVNSLKILDYNLFADRIEE